MTSLLTYRLRRMEQFVASRDLAIVVHGDRIGAPRRRVVTEAGHHEKQLEAHIETEQPLIESTLNLDA